MSKIPKSDFFLFEALKTIRTEQMVHSIKVIQCHILCVSLQYYVNCERITFFSTDMGLAVCTLCSTLMLCHNHIYLL